MLRRGACPEPPYILETRPVAQRTEETYYRTCQSLRGYRQSISWNKGTWLLESVPLKHDCAVCSKEPVVSKCLVVGDKARRRCRPSKSIVSLLAGLTSTQGVKRNENCKDIKQRKRKEKNFLARNLILLLENSFEIFFINESGNRDGPVGTGVVGDKVKSHKS